MTSGRYIGAIAALLPSLTLAFGVAATNAAAATPAAAPEALRWAVVLAAAAPIAAALVLAIVLPGYDGVMLAVAAMLVAVGTATLYGMSLSPGDAGQFYTSIATRHAMFAAFGFLALVLGTFAERFLDRAARFPFTLLIVAVVLTVATVLAGETVNGARLWLDVGPVRIQPSEIARFLIALFVAAFLHERRHLLAAPWRVRSLDLPPAPYLLPVAGALAVAVGVLVVQNDLGMAALVALGAAAAVVSVVQSRAAVVIVALMLAGALAASYVAVDRVRDRVAGWLDPWHEAAGRGYQFVQAEFSLSGGGLSGAEPAASALNVPEAHTDLILVAIGSRFGLPVVLTVLVLAAVLVCRCIIAGLRAGDGFRALTAVSLGTLLAIQIVLIVGGSLRVLPLTGLTFPLVSYGGTSMLVTQFALGLILGIGARSGKINADREVVVPPASQRHGSAASWVAKGEITP